jgi:hypothetical protein
MSILEGLGDSGGQRRAMGQPKHAERNHRRASRVRVEEKVGGFAKPTQTRSCTLTVRVTMFNIFGIKGTLVAPEYLEFSLRLSSFNLKYQ